jgi:hypothetical protein
VLGRRAKTAVSGAYPAKDTGQRNPRKHLLTIPTYL